jgi:hypothetical protein
MKRFLSLFLSKNKPKTKGLWLFLLVFVVFTADRAIGFMIQKTLAKSSFRYAQLYWGQPNPDILLVGNSRGYALHSPEIERQTGKTTLNLSFYGLPPNVSKCFVMDYLDKKPLPKIIVIDVSFSDRNNDILALGFGMYAPFSARLDALIKNISLENDAWAGKKIIYGGYLSHVFYYNSPILSYNFNGLRLRDTGWVERGNHLTPQLINAFNAGLLTMYFSENKFSPIKEMVKYAQNKGVAVKLIVGSYTPAYAAQIRETYTLPLIDYLEKETHLTVHDYSNFLKNYDEMSDFTHPTEIGVVKYIKKLKEDAIFD